MDLNLNVNVQFGVSSPLERLLESALERLGQRAGAPGFSSSNIASVSRGPETEALFAEPAGEPKAESTQPAGVEEPQVTTAGAAAELTSADVRAAIERTRRRIEGEDYDVNPDSEGYKNYHNKLTAEFIRIANVLGAQKPSMLPDHDSRARFIAMCDELIAESGKITTNAPF